MKRSTLASLLAAGLLLAPALSYADPDADRSHPMAYATDSAITVKIKAKLADERMNSLRRISVDTDSTGEVMLTGTAHSQGDIDRAIAIARGTEGVMSVKSTVQVRKDD